MPGDGSLCRKSPNGPWYWVINDGWDQNLRGGKGWYHQKWINLETTDKNEAKERRKQILAEMVQKGRYDPPSAQSLGEWLDFWLNEVQKPNVEPSTYSFYEYIIRVHIKPDLGTTPLKHLGPEDIIKFFNKKRQQKKLGKKKDADGNFIPTNEPLSKRTLKGIEIVLSMALAKAVSLHKIPESPMTGLDRLKYERPNVKYLLTADVADFLSKIRNDRWYYAYLTAFGSGARLGEIAALRWPRVNLAEGYLKIVESREYVRTHAKEGPKTKLVTGKPKTESGVRDVPLPIDAIQGLREWREIQIRERWEWEQKRLQEQERPNRRRKHPRAAYFQSDYVFTREDGHPVTPNYLSKHFLKLTREHGFEGLTFHTQRHSYASMLLEAGEDMKVIQANLGDATMKIVSDTYTHVAEKLKRKAATKLNGFTKIQ